MYKVFKDHVELAEYKTLAAAKKLAEKEHGEVFCDGKKVYHTEQDGSADMAPAIAPNKEVATVVEAPNRTGAIQPEIEDSTGVGGRYRIESLMNVRLHPALNADIVGLAQPGTIVTVTGIKDDWMAVQNGAETVFILYGKGHFATKL